jgi:hypothetical protein
MTIQVESQLLPCWSSRIIHKDLALVFTGHWRQAATLVPKCDLGSAAAIGGRTSAGSIIG